MTFSQRERILAIVTAGLLAVIALRFAYSFWFGTGRELRRLRTNLTEEVARKQSRLEKINRAKSQLEEFQRRSLPGDAQLAQSVYSNWLLEVAERSGLDEISVDAGAARTRSGRYTGLRFHLQAEATMDELVEFLFEFYSAGYLHKLRSVTLRPRTRSERLDVAITIEAMSLAGAPVGTELPKLAAPRMQLANLDSYRRTIARKNFFRPYSPPRRPALVDRRPAPPPFDPSKFTYLTAIVGPVDQLEAWLLCRPTGKLFRLREGQSFQVGELRGTVRRLEPRRAEVEINGQPHTLALGDSLRESTPLDRPAETRTDQGQPPAPLAKTAASLSEPPALVHPEPAPKPEPR